MAAVTNTRANTMESCEISCCVLESKNGAGQGILLRRSNYSEHTYVLLTCHHLITSKAASHNFTVSFYDGERKKSFKLNEDNVGSCYSCCGENGILGKGKHFDDHCPFELDFTYIELKGSDVKEKLSDIELIHFNLSMEASNAQVDGSINSLLIRSSCHFYGRNWKKPQEVRHKEHGLFLKYVSRDQQDQKKVCVLRDWCVKVPCLNVIMDDDLDICGEGFSGAPIYAIHQNGKPLLVGIHTGSEEDEDGTSDYTTSKNTNFLWILQLLKVELEAEKDQHLLPSDVLPSHVLWAIFLRYEKDESKTKYNSFLSRVAEDIKDQLYQTFNKVKLNDDEEKMFEKIEQFFKCRNERYGTAKLPVTKKIPPISKDHHDQGIATTPTEIATKPAEEQYREVTDTGFYSDEINLYSPDGAPSADRQALNSELVTGQNEFEFKFKIKI